jgi:hypothetical protein
MRGFAVTNSDTATVNESDLYALTVCAAEATGAPVGAGEIYLLFRHPALPLTPY